MFVVCAGVLGEVLQALAVLPNHVDLARTGHDTNAGQLEAIESDLLAVWRPRRPCLVGPCLEELPDARAVRVHHEQVALAGASVVRKRELVALRRPCRAERFHAVGGQLADIRTVGAHRVYSKAGFGGFGASVAAESDLGSIRRPGGFNIRRRGVSRGSRGRGGRGGPPAPTLPRP